MNVKIDTKEKFTVITPSQELLSANMTEEMNNLLHAYLQKDIPHVVFNMVEIKSMDEETITTLAEIQQLFYENDASFVICSVNEGIKKLLDEMELSDIMNITPTESEAWDIVQMEEIERELLGGDLEEQ